MPYTFSHAAAVLPIRKLKKLSFPALVLGTFSPDLEYAMRITQYKHYTSFSHSLLGILLFCLPVGLVLLLLYRWLWVHSFELWFNNYKPCKQQNKNLAIVIVSLLIGSASHVMWDSFTHKKRWATLYFDFLTTKLPLPTQPPLYNVLQHLSSVMGLLFLIIFFLKWYQPHYGLKIKNSLFFCAFIAFASLGVSATLNLYVINKRLIILTGLNTVLLTIFSLSIVGFILKFKGTST